MLAVFSLLFCLSGVVATGDSRERFALETGLDLDLIGVVQLEAGEAELTIIFVYINERTFDSRISPELRQRLLPYIGKNAFYVNPNLKSVVLQSSFDPSGVSVQQGGSRFTPDVGAWIEMTPGFLMGRFEVNPSGASQGSGSEGILVLGDAVDPMLPLELAYFGVGAWMNISKTLVTSTPPAGAPWSSATLSHDPISVSPFENVGTLEDLLAHPDFSAEAMAAFLGLPNDDVQVIELLSRGESLRMTFIRLEESIQQSTLDSAWIQTLEPLIGTGAVMVWVFSSTGANFSPWYFYIQQAGTNFLFFSAASFVELTEGFLQSERVDGGEILAGVIRLPRGVEAGLGFSVFYGTSGVEFP